MLIEELIERGKVAQNIANNYSQEKVDELVTAIVYEIIEDDKVVEEISVMAMEETELGDVPSKRAKFSSKPKGVLFDILREKSVGIIEEIPEKGLIKVAKPVGIIGSLVPSTQPEQHPVNQALFSIKARNSIIFSPHPRGKKTTYKVVELIRQVLKKYDAPEDLVMCIEEPSLDLTNELMEKVDLVIATGGSSMVKAAYSSGTPAFGVGAGNANIIVDETADLDDAANKIKSSKTFDLAAGCSCDNSVIINESVYDEMLLSFKKIGGHLLNQEEKEKLQKVIWTEYPNNNTINRDIVAKPVEYIAERAGITIPNDTSILLVEETGSGFDYPFSGEKMCLVMAIYKAKDMDESIEILNKNLEYSGAGHSCGIFSTNKDNIEKVYLDTFTTRVVVNQAQAATNTGNWISGMPFTSSLGCGTWGGNIASENIVLKHYMNITWVINEIDNREPSNDELYSGFTPRK